MQQNTKEKVNHIGEKHMMNCGVEAEIIAWRKYADIDIRFSDGIVIKHRAYSDFIRGQIKHPAGASVHRIGEKRMMNCGLEAEIITWRKYADIDIRFSDGVVIQHKGYGSFSRGQIKHPAGIGVHRIGEKHMMTYGIEAEIIAWRKSNDIDVRFSDGAIAEHKSYHAFTKGQIRYPLGESLRKIGEKRTMNCGLEAEIIAYRNRRDITVRFSNGIIAEHKNYGNFCRGQIGCPIGPAIERKRVQVVYNSIEYPSITACCKANNLDAQFVLRSRRAHFPDKSIEEILQDAKTYQKPSEPPNKNKTNLRIGETKTMYCGLSCKIVEYTDKQNITVIFEDGEKVCHKNYKNFTTRHIAHPVLSTHTKSIYKGFETKFSAFVNDKAFYECKCLKCGAYEVFTPQQMIEHSKRHAK